MYNFLFKVLVLSRPEVAGRLTLNLLTTTIVAPPSIASKWQMGFNSALKGLKPWYVQKVANNGYAVHNLLTS